MSARSPEGPGREQLRWVRVLGHVVRVSVRPGSGDGPPLLVCNGIGAGLDVLQPFVDAVDPGIAVIRFDVPGVGGSATPRLPYTFPVLACFVTRLLDALGHDRFDVLGISWGGGLAQQLAFQNPRRCRRVVLVSTGTGITEMAPGSQKGLQIVVDDAAAAREELLSRGVVASEVDVQPWGRFVYFSDPDGNTWALQQLPARDSF